MRIIDGRLILLPVPCNWVWSIVVGTTVDAVYRPWNIPAITLEALALPPPRDPDQPVNPDCAGVRIENPTDVLWVDTCQANQYWDRGWK